MNAEEQLKEAAAIGDEMRKMLFDLAPMQSMQVRERWDSLMAGCVRADLVEPAAPADYMEEDGDGDHPEVPQ